MAVFFTLHLCHQCLWQQSSLLLSIICKETVTVRMTKSLYNSLNWSTAQQPRSMSEWQQGDNSSWHPCSSLTCYQSSLSQTPQWLSHWLTLLHHINQPTSRDLPIQATFTKQLIEQRINLSLSALCSSSVSIRYKLKRGVFSRHFTFSLRRTYATFLTGLPSPRIKHDRAASSQMHIPCFLNESFPVGWLIYVTLSTIFTARAQSYSTISEKYQKAERGQIMMSYWMWEQFHNFAERI